MKCSGRGSRTRRLASVTAAPGSQAPCVEGDENPVVEEARIAVAALVEAHDEHAPAREVEILGIGVRRGRQQGLEIAYGGGLLAGKHAALLWHARRGAKKAAARRPPPSD